VTTQFVHAAMFARLEHVSGGGRGDALGLGTSEAIGTLSESRHYQTPHIIQPGNQVACVFTGTGTAYNLIQVYVKGRVIVDSGDALVDASFTSPADVTVH
jgi:adenine deaminase